MSLWHQALYFFDRAKQSWQNEGRKYLLTQEEVQTINQQYDQLSSIISTFDDSEEQWAAFMSCLADLRLSLRAAGRKMGYATIFTY